MSEASTVRTNGTGDRMVQQGPSWPVCVAEETAVSRGEVVGGFRLQVGV